jgi:hypothetical protein
LPHGAIGVPDASAGRDTEIIGARLAHGALGIRATLPREGTTSLNAGFTHRALRVGHALVWTGFARVIHASETRGAITVDIALSDRLTGAVDAGRVRRTHDHRTRVHNFATEVLAQLIGGTFRVVTAIAHEITGAVQTDFSCATIHIGLATARGLTLATRADFAWQTIHIINTLRVRDTLPIKTKVAGHTIKIAETHGHAWDTLAVQTLFIGPTVNIRTALSLERNADAALTDLVFGALSVVLAECVFTTAADTISTQTTVAIDTAFRGDAGKLVAHKSRSTVDINDTFANKGAQVVDALEIRWTLIVGRTFDWDG